MKALFASSSWFENLVDSSESATLFLLKVSFCAPSSATPESFMSFRYALTMRICAASSEVSLETASSAL